MNGVDPAGTLTDQELASRLVVGMEGPWPSAREETWLARRRPAGVILFGRNVQSFHQLQALCARLRQLVPGLEIMADHEGGPVSQLSAAVGRPPAAWTLGQLDDPELTRAVHRETARRIGLAGVNGVLAPCADVMAEPRNPVIGVRAFGTEADLVARHTTAAVEGLRDGGARSCLKHWPGHGASRQDSHLAAALGGGDDGSVPFLAGLAAGADAVMVGHLAPAEGGRPATLDVRRLERWRHELERAAGHPVRLFADDVTMGGLRPAMADLGIVPGDGTTEGMVDPGALPAAWLRQLAKAGSDLLLIRGIPWSAFPLTEMPPTEAAAGGVPWDDGAAPVWPVSAYDRARRLILDRLDAEFPDAGLATGWLDLTAGDRWETPRPDGSDPRREFQAHLERVFARVVALNGSPGRNEAPPELSLTRLVVSSHRPLPEVRGAGFLVEGTAGPTGICLALGHPSLTADLEKILGSGWRVSHCPEIDWGLFGETA